MSLAEACDLIVDCPHKTAPESDEAYAYAVGTKAVSDGRIAFDQARPVSEETYGAWIARATPREGDLIFCREAPVGPVALVPAQPRVCLGQRTVLLRANADVVVPRYLMYLLLAPSTQDALHVLSEGSTVAHLNVADVRRFQVVFPTIDEQQRVLSVLGAIDDKIDSNRRLSTVLGETSAEIYRHVTGDAPLGLPLGHVAAVLDCLHSKKPTRRDEGKLLLQLANIRADGLLDLRSRYLIDDGDYAMWTRRMETRRGDCVVTNVGRVGAVARVPDVSAALGRNMTGIRCKPEWPYPAVLVEALLSRPIRRQIIELTDAGTVMNAFNVRSIPKLQLPSLEAAPLAGLQDALEPLWGKREALLAESQALGEVRDAVLPRLLSGRLRVADVAGTI